jgi:hypothetical protein
MLVPPTKPTDPPTKCNPVDVSEGACAPGVSICMESAAGVGDWECRLKYSLETAPEMQTLPKSFCGEQVYAVERSDKGATSWSSIGIDIT